ncbi:hypothetical protein MRBLAR21_000942 [Paenarthrobacter nitroguajacolicus]
METAWKIHAALVDWTGRVDTKASFSFTLQSAALGVIVALSDEGRMFGLLEGPWQNIAYRVACLALIFGAASSMWVVIPRLRMRHVKKEWPDNFIYFGHLKFWKPEDLEAKIRQADMLSVLSKQLVGMSRIAWAKHILVKIAMSLASVGGLSLLLCAALIQAGLTP